MDEIINLYNNNRKFLLGNNIPWLSNIREDLIKKIKTEGLPNKKKEIWKYSDINKINKIKYNFDNKDSKVIDVKDKNCVCLLNGHSILSKDLEDSNKILIENLNKSIDNFKNYFSFDNRYFNNDFTIDMNTLFLSNGLTISLNDNENFFLIIKYQNSSDDITNYIRNFIKINKNAKLTLVEDFSGADSKRNSFNIFNNFWLEKGSRVEHIIIQNFEQSSDLVYSSLIYCYEQSLFNQFSFQKGGQSVKLQHSTNLLGPNSSAVHGGVYFGKNKQFIDNKTAVVHHVENCKSNQKYKGVLTDESNATYLSNTLVKPEAQKTNGYQLSRGMLLSDKCKLNTKPELKIYADDVKCSHGSTIGAIDQNQLFYLQSRGLSKMDSENLLIKAFCKDVLEMIEDDKIRSNISLLIDDWLINK